MISTRFTQLVGCTVPLQQAGMGGVSPPELAAAVSEAGGLGMVGTARAGLTPATLAVLLERVRLLTTRPFGVNFLVSPVHLEGRHGRQPLDLACVGVAAEAARVVDFFYGDPDPKLVEIVHKGGALACWQVGSRSEAVAAVEAGCDLIVAQGVEAGGHVRGRIGLLPLLAEILDAVDVPVLAAGGIGSARAMAAALAAGAQGVRVGTRFIAAQEAGAHPDYVAALIAAEAGDTIHTDAFRGGWPDAPHRVLRSCLEAARMAPAEIIAEGSRLDGTRMPIARFATAVADRMVTGHIAALPLWAGESVGGVKRIQPAAAIVHELAEGAEALLRRW
ncbi:NAD(P)H-dependent flavin oxidoreductase [Falsiroseomonas sp. HC035]|uniref:NAD(P)H-dependent flavin oxidoreductase n=1 Tax=Falsiroseomonas sp. HC035 TaxID=3390999 RepID=UPI003D3116C1